IGDDQAEGGEIPAHTLAPAGIVGADAVDQIHLASNKHAAVVRWHEHGVGVVDAVTGQSAHAEHLDLRLLVGTADVGDIGLPPAVDLGRGDHGVAFAAPDHVEHPTEWHPAGIGRLVVAPRPKWN